MSCSDYYSYLCHVRCWICYFYQTMIALTEGTGKDVDADIMKQELMNVLELSKQ